jgi:hypothetical protein
MAFKVIEQLLLPERIAGRVLQLTSTEPVAAEIDGDCVRSVTVQNLETGHRTVLIGTYFLDATECGDVLALTGTEYVTGAESQAETGEPHAPAEADPLDMQAVTRCFALDYIPGQDHTIERPEDYDFWREYRPSFGPDRLLSWAAPDPPEPHRVRLTSLFGDPGTFPLFRYRRLIEKEQFLPGTIESDITLVNWPQNDYFLGPVYEVPEDEAARHVRRATQLSLALLYWLQTEAPRRDGGQGYPGLRFRADLMGTEDGMAKALYIRESRRILAERTIVEQDLNPEIRPEATAAGYLDSVGVGAYRIDLHPSTRGRTYVDVPSLPFEIPLSSLIPIRVENLLPAAKNIGTTHITNGCYRLHPVEWNIGEVAGTLAAHCLDTRSTPHQVCGDPARVSALQTVLDDQGVERHWPRLRPL